MGRKSKLTEDQWADVGRRMLDGESQRALAAEFGISEATLRQYFRKQEKLPTVQKVAGMIVETAAALKSLPISSQVNAQKLADRLMAISDDLAGAASFGARTARQLSELAHKQVQKVNPADPMDAGSVEAMKGAAMFTRQSNDSSSIALNLIAAASREKRGDNDGKEPGLAVPVFNVTVKGR